MKITYVAVQMAALGPLSVTAPESNLPSAAPKPMSGDDRRVDMPLHRRADGTVTVPATTIAGSLRAHLSDDLRIPLMGTVDGQAVASPLHVLDATVRPPSGSDDSVTRQRTAIDRERAAAANNRLFDSEAAPADSTITAMFELHDDGDLQAALLDALTSWQPRFGRGTTTGAGACEIVSIRHATLDLHDDADLVIYLNLDGPRGIDALLQRAGTSISVRPRETRMVISRRYEIVDALHIGCGRANGNVLLIERDAQRRPVIPGSSIKGVLRSRCEYILRSIGVAACIDASCGTCPACLLFGYTLPTPDELGRTGRRGLVSFHEATINALSEINRAHVAIDRVTGGARDSALYSMESIDLGSFTIAVEALSEIAQWAEGLLLAALRDVDDGYVGLGSATTRGYGTLSPAAPVDTRTDSIIRESLATLVDKFPGGSIT